VYADTKRPPRRNLHGFVGRVLAQAAADHLKRGNPGVFRVLDLGSYGFSLVPVEARDKEGVVKEAVLPLDAVISFPEETRSPDATLALIAKKIGEAAGRPIGAMGSFTRGEGVRMGAKAESARDVLIRMFGSFMRMGQGALPEGYAALTRSRTWRLNYNVESGGHILYVEAVTRQTPRRLVRAWRSRRCCRRRFRKRCKEGSMHCGWAGTPRRDRNHECAVRAAAAGWFPAVGFARVRRGKTMRGTPRRFNIPECVIVPAWGPLERRARNV
jgi:hypothetical protein